MTWNSRRSWQTLTGDRYTQSQERRRLPRTTSLGTEYDSWGRLWISPLWCIIIALLIIMTMLVYLFSGHAVYILTPRKMYWYHSRHPRWTVATRASVSCGWFVRLLSIDRDCEVLCSGISTCLQACTTMYTRCWFDWKREKGISVNNTEYHLQANPTWVGIRDTKIKHGHCSGIFIPYEKGPPSSHSAMCFLIFLELWYSTLAYRQQ